MASDQGETQSPFTIKASNFVYACMCSLIENLTIKPLLKQFASDLIQLWNIPSLTCVYTLTVLAVKGLCISWITDQ